MQLSKRCEYALRALLDIAVAEQMGKERIALHELSEYEKIPSKFLEQILNQLRKAGYLTSKRGPAGGYKLAKPPAQIFFGEVVRLINGPLAPIRCASPSAYQKCSCPSEELCGIHLLMLDLRAAISGVLDMTNLETMVARIKNQVQRTNQIFRLVN